MHKFLKGKIIEFGLDTSHWLGVRTNCGIHHKGGYQKLSSDQILILDRNKGRKEHISILRRALLDTGKDEKCECGLGSTWKGKKLQLQVDHINGNPIDNREENIRFICPNCHSQTENFSGNKNKKPAKFKKKKVKKNKYCIDCGKQCSNRANRCKDCSQTNALSICKINWPSNEELAKLVRTTNYSVVARKLGVSNTAVKKRLRHATVSQLAEDLPLEGSG